MYITDPNAFLFLCQYDDWQFSYLLPIILFEKLIGEVHKQKLLVDRSDEGEGLC